MSAATSPECLHLSPRASRVVASAGRRGLAVSVVRIGRTEVVHGRVSFAHGARVVVRPRTTPASELADWGEQAVLMSLLVDGCAHAVRGQVREVGERGLSIDLRGDLVGTDPRRSPREQCPSEPLLEVRAGDRCLDAQLLNRSQAGAALRMVAQDDGLEVGRILEVTELEGGWRAGEVRHCTPVSEELVVVGVALQPAPDGADSSAGEE